MLAKGADGPALGEGPGGVAERWLPSSKRPSPSVLASRCRVLRHVLERHASVALAVIVEVQSDTTGLTRAPVGQADDPSTIRG